MILTDTITLAVGATSKTFRVPAIYPQKNVKRLGSETLRNRLVSHVVGQRISYTVTFATADVIAEEAFFREVCLANTVELTVNVVGTGARTKQCTFDDGDVLLEYLENIILLPQLKLTFREVERENV